MSTEPLPTTAHNRQIAHSCHTGLVLEELLRPLQTYLADDSLTEICINRPGEIWTEGKTGWQKHSSPMDLAACERLAMAIAGFSRQHFNAQHPIVSASLPTNERIQMVMPPACQNNTVSMTIRRHSSTDKTLCELEADGAFRTYNAASEKLQQFETTLLQQHKKGDIRAFLETAVASRRNILIAGKTGSGKTTVAKSLIRLVPEEERLVTIEDVHELHLKSHPNKVHLFYAGNAGGVTAKEALASTLRMKPDRILLAEIRGDEAWEFIKSINTGHPGAISTIHANSATDAFEQMTAFVKDSPTGAHLDTGWIRRRLFMTVDIVLFFQNRLLKEIYYDPEKKRQ